MPRHPEDGSSTRLQKLIDRQVEGDVAAREALLNHACDRLLRLTRRMFHAYPNLHRWEQTDDVFQNSMVRLHRAFAEVRLDSVRHFSTWQRFKFVGNFSIWQSIILGPEGRGTKHHTDGQPSDDEGGSIHESADEPDDLSSWSEFHAQIGKLSEAEQEVVNLVFYEGLPQEEAAKVLGISFRTLKRRWQAVKLKLHEELNRDPT